MKTLVTTVTERGQVSIPAQIREQLKIQPGQRLVWEQVSDTECRVRLRPALVAPGAVATLGYAKRFRKARRTSEWIDELREGDRLGWVSLGRPVKRPPGRTSPWANSP